MTSAHQRAIRCYILVVANIGTHDLPDMLSALWPGLGHSYISGKSLVPMLQLLHIINLLCMHYIINCAFIS